MPFQAIPELTARIDVEFANNESGDITPALLRSFLHDVVDSFKYGQAEALPWWMIGIGRTYWAANFSPPTQYAALGGWNDITIRQDFIPDDFDDWQEAYKSSFLMFYLREDVYDAYTISDITIDTKSVFAEEDADKPFADAKFYSVTRYYDYWGTPYVVHEYSLVPLNEIDGKVISITATKD